MADSIRRAFVTGWPVAHSRSPLIHNHWLERYGIEGRYELYPCNTADFPAFLKSLAEHGFVGGNITIPHKETAFTLADHCDETARSIGAVNTVWLENGRLSATNTDAYGFAANLDQMTPGWDIERQRRPALVMGAGGSTRAVLHVLAARGFTDIRIVNRTIAKAEALRDEFAPTAAVGGWDQVTALAEGTALVVNTTALWMNDPLAPLPLDLPKLPTDCLVTDIVYTPIVTPLLAAAREAGLATIDGLGMLLHQAVPGFERWFGVRPEVTADLRHKVVTSLGASA